MSFIDLVENEITSLRLTPDQKRVCKELNSLDWVMESSDNKPVYRIPNGTARFEVMASGKLQELEK